MKKIVLSLMMVLCIGSMASAQNQNDNQRPPRQQPTPEQMVEMRANMLEKELNLTSSQKAAITQILNDDAVQCKQEMEANKDKMKEHKDKKNDKKARPERRPMDDKMMARQQETDKKIEAVLDANQKEQYAQLKQRQHHGHHGHGGPQMGGPGQGGPGQGGQGGCCCCSSKGAPQQGQGCPPPPQGEGCNKTETTE